MSDIPQKNNPLHGITLEAILEALVEFYGWEELGERITINCFTKDPSIKSSLKFLRKTPWLVQKLKVSIYICFVKKRKWTYCKKITIVR